MTVTSPEQVETGETAQVEVAVIPPYTDLRTVQTLVQGDHQVTWGQLLARASQVANLFAAAGVGLDRGGDGQTTADDHTPADLSDRLGGRASAGAQRSWRAAAPTHNRADPSCGAPFVWRA